MVTLPTFKVSLHHLFISFKCNPTTNPAVIGSEKDEFSKVTGHQNSQSSSIEHPVVSLIAQIHYLINYIITFVELFMFIQV